MFDIVLDSERMFEHHLHVHRTYVRRRLAAVIVAVGVTAAASGSIVRGLVGATSPRLVSTRTYVVSPGDTLWSIASASAPDRDPRETVAEIGAANGVGPGLVPGQVLVIPGPG
jgi:hypothetical protein